MLGLSSFWWGTAIGAATVAFGGGAWAWLKARARARLARLDPPGP